MSKPQEMLNEMRARAIRDGTPANDPYIKFLDSAASRLRENERQYRRDMFMAPFLALAQVSAIAAALYLLIYLPLRWYIGLFD